MKIREILSSRKAIGIISFIIIIYLVLGFFVLNSDPLFSVIKYFLKTYLALVEKLAYELLHLFVDKADIDNNFVSPDSTGLVDYLAQIRYKKIPFVSLMLIWITRTSMRDKGIFTFLLILVHFFINSVYYAITPYVELANENTGYLLFGYFHLSSLLILFTCLFIWYIWKKAAIIMTLSKYKKSWLFETKATSVFIAIYIYLIINNFPVDFYNFLPWINYIFLSAKKILDILGYEAMVEPYALVGSNGYIIMHKDCLGIGAMFLFASIVFLTGRNDIKRWIYIIAGVIFLNFVNILRFVFLFIYIQKNPVYDKAMDVHATYDYIIYSIILIFWILWFEKFSDLKGKNEKGKQI